MPSRLCQFNSVAKKWDDTEVGPLFSVAAAVSAAPKYCRRHACHYRFYQCNQAWPNFASALTRSFAKILKNLVSSEPRFLFGKMANPFSIFSVDFAMPA